jgi:hypothetical protein
MLEIPEYNLICASESSNRTVNTFVKIDGKMGAIPSKPFDLGVIVKLAERLLTGEFVYISFDDQPKILTGIDLTTHKNAAKATFSARSINDDDDFPEHWESSPSIL